MIAQVLGNIENPLDKQTRELFRKNYYVKHLQFFKRVVFSPWELFLHYSIVYLSSFKR